MQAQLIHNDESQEESLAGKKAQRHVGLAIGCGSTGCKQQTLQPPKRHGTTPHQSPDGAVAHQPNHDWPLRHGYQRLKLPSRVRGAPPLLGVAPFEDMASLSLLFGYISRKNRLTSTPFLQSTVWTLVQLSCKATLETASSAVLSMERGRD